ncbi:MAG: NosD domain-containing protein [Thermoplasmata archaeon]
MRLRHHFLQLLICFWSIYALVAITPSTAWGEQKLSFRLNSDAELAESLPGNGSMESPYVISGLIIDGKNSGFCFYIGNTTKHVLIENCTFFNASNYGFPFFWNSGVVFYNATNITLRNCSFYSNGNDNWQRYGAGLYINQSQNLVIEHCSFSSNYFAGIKIDFSSWIKIENCTVERSYFGSSVAGFVATNSSKCTVANSKFSQNACDIWVENGESNTILGNEIGIAEHNGMWIVGTKHTVICNNSVSGASEHGIRIVDSIDSCVEWNNVSGCTYGVVVKNCRGIEVSENRVSTQHKVCADTGLLLWNTTESRVWRNDVWSQDGGSISLQGSAWNELCGNWVRTGNGYGISLIDSVNNTVRFNEVSHSYQGILISGESHHNWIHHNRFLNNVYHAEDANGTNFWDDGSEGNYWDTWLEPDEDLD